MVRKRLSFADSGYRQAQLRIQNGADVEHYWGGGDGYPVHPTHFSIPRRIENGGHKVGLPNRPVQPLSHAEAQWAGAGRYLLGNDIHPIVRHQILHTLQENGQFFDAGGKQVVAA